MKIKSFKVHGLFNTLNTVNLNFNEDLNILTGKNGAGKTTLLKLIWYIASGNSERAIAEIPFVSARLETDIYTLNIKTMVSKDIPFESYIVYHDKTKISADVLNVNLDDMSPQVTHILAEFIGQSCFFPTFRLIEGGFTIEKYNIKHEIIQHLLASKSDDSIDLSHDLHLLSNKLSSANHKFISSVSASGINSLLVSKYAEIMSLIQPFQSDKKNLVNTLVHSVSFDNNDKMLNLSSDIRRIDYEISKIRMPLTEFEKNISNFLKNYEFHFGQRIQFSKLEDKGKEKEKIGLTHLLTNNIKPLYDINLLSAGEKQILSFLGYNAFYNDTIFFIDEPEISLNADWQRILFRILKKQNPTNQFIISTHSPFIYSKYPDKEVCIDQNNDRGNNKD